MLYKRASSTQGTQTLSDFASGYLYFGLHKVSEGWVIREWAPNATEVFLIGDFNNWRPKEEYRLKSFTQWYLGGSFHRRCY